MNLMTVNEQRELFNNIANAHEQLNDFGYGEAWEIEEKMNKEAEYNMMYVVPMQSVKGKQTIDRTYMILILDIPKKDNSNQVEVWSDTEQILDDIIITLRKSSKDYELIGDPVMFPFAGDKSDWVSGYRAEIVLRTKTRSNTCDLPMTAYTYPSASDYRYVEIVDQDGNVLATVQAKAGAKYTVTVLSTLRDTITANVTTILDDII